VLIYKIIVIIIINRYYHYATGRTLKLIIASSVIARTAIGVRCILGTVVFTKATSDESKGWSRGLIYVGHTGGCISKVESCTDATTAASIFPPSSLYIYNIYIHIICIYGQRRQRYTTTPYCVDAATPITTVTTVFSKIIINLLLLYRCIIIIYVRKIVFQCFNEIFTMYVQRPRKK